MIEARMRRLSYPDSVWCHWFRNFLEEREKPLKYFPLLPTTENPATLSCNARRTCPCFLYENMSEKKKQFCYIFNMNIYFDFRKQHAFMSGIRFHSRVVCWLVDTKTAVDRHWVEGGPHFAFTSWPWLRAIISVKSRDEEIRVPCGSLGMGVHQSNILLKLLQQRKQIWNFVFKNCSLYL